MIFSFIYYLLISQLTPFFLQSSQSHSSFSPFMCRFSPKVTFKCIFAQMIQPEMLMTKQAVGMPCLWVRENEWELNRLNQGRLKTPQIAVFLSFVSPLAVRMCHVCVCCNSPHSNCSSFQILVVPEGAEAVSRPSPDYPMLPTIPLSAFSDPKKTKTSHVSKVCSFANKNFELGYLSPALPAGCECRAVY